MEYIKILETEISYAKKELLYSEMETLSILKRYQKYKELRRQELALKNLLRKKITEIQEEIKIVDRSMPHMPVERSNEDKEKMVLTAKKKRDIESEIDEIKRKIDRLKL